jgi:hypothetical protein
MDSRVAYLYTTQSRVIAKIRNAHGTDTATALIFSSDFARVAPSPLGLM